MISEYWTNHLHQFMCHWFNWHILASHRMPIGYNRYISNLSPFPTWDKLNSKWTLQSATSRISLSLIPWFVMTEQRTWVLFSYMAIVLPTTATLKVKHGSVLAGGSLTPLSPDLMRFFMKLHTVYPYFKRTGSGSYMITAPRQQSTSMITWSSSANPLHCPHCKQLFQMLALREHLFYNSSIRNLFPFPLCLIIKSLPTTNLVKSKR